MRGHVRSAFIALTFIISVIAPATAAHAAYDGCYTGQVGYYTQSGGGGHCYGFSGTNSSFATWGLNDNIRSGKNVGTSGMRARLYRDTNHTGGVGFCLLQGQQSNNPASPQGASNDWAWGC